jgi:steroid delta-isomerase-like uncharacterized protein
MGADADLIRRLTDEVYLGGNVQLVDEVFADDFVSHDVPPGFPATKEGQRQLAQLVVEAFSDRKTEFDELMETTDGRIIQNWCMVGTHSGEIFGIPASGQQVYVRGIDIFRCADGKVAEHWGVADMSDLMEKAST